MPLARICRWAPLSALAVLILASPATGPAASRPGRMLVAPTHVVAGSNGNVLTFTFTAETALQGQVLFDVARSWTRPQLGDPAAPGYLRIDRRTCASARIASVIARRVLIKAVCARGRQFLLTYGPATAPQLSSEGYVFLTQIRPDRARGKRKIRLRFQPLASTKQPVVIVDGGPAVGLALTATSVATAGTAFTVTARAVDAFANAAGGYAGVITFASSDPAAALPPPYAFVSADGSVHVFTGLMLKTPGTQTIRAFDNLGFAAETGPITVYPSQAR